MKNTITQKVLITKLGFLLENAYRKFTWDDGGVCSTYDGCYSVKGRAKYTGHYLHQGRVISLTAVVSGLAKFGSRSKDIACEVGDLSVWYEGACLDISSFDDVHGRLPQTQQVAGKLLLEHARVYLSQVQS